MTAAVRLAVDVAEVVAAWLHLVVWTGVVMALVALAGAAVAAVDGPAAGGLVVGSLSVVVDLVLVHVALHARSLPTVRLLMPQTHPRAIRRAAIGVFAALLLVAVVLTVTGCVPDDRPTQVVTTTVVEITGVVNQR
ncbi:archaellin/type IV pilin N-terminal domain-containing protein [Saccharothrix texasensis]|uniref:Flagellin-like protein n=1 Tax=Saccharothrix texasensis TaxID=103734 RepID=A0A3N1H1A6_9PSEU|nr:archaellin/type IV pilin N-terminal domain-containing protein [Saccharothrix texasensis]ROP36259.1 flagellin-like protein [Saccharothrix texasensis]